MRTLNNFSNNLVNLTHHGHEVAQHAAENEEKLGDVVLHHIGDTHEFEIFSLKLPLPEFEFFGIDLSITKHVVMLWLAAVLVFLVFNYGFRWNRMVPKGKLTGFFEPIVVFVRDEIVYMNFGKEGKNFLPFFLTVFFFILFMNLLGLIPFMATATSNVSVTGALAAVSFILIHFSGIMRHGFFKHWRNFIPPGVPWWIAPIILPLEIIGTTGRSFALCIRLFASMTAGHMVILAFLGLIIVLHNVFVGFFSVPVALIVFILEIFFAFLQAYIFTFLSALFISMTYHGAH